LLSAKESEFAVLCATLDSLNPVKVLSRGYSISKKNKKIVASIKELNVNDCIEIQYADGKVLANILEVK
jgi:exodeoxyribonuclease VII large subunit